MSDEAGEQGAWLDLPEQPLDTSVNVLWDEGRLRLSWGGSREEDLNLRLKGTLLALVPAICWALLTVGAWLGWLVLAAGIVIVILQAAHHNELQHSKQLHLLPDIIEFSRRPGKWGLIRTPAAGAIRVYRRFLIGALVVRGPETKWVLHELRDGDGKWLTEVLLRWCEASPTAAAVDGTTAGDSSSDPLTARTADD